MAGRKKAKNFEESVARLEDIVTKMESEDLPLDDSIKIFKEAMDLISECNSKLDEAEQRINIIVKDKNEELKEEEFSFQEEI